jgi:hypothetical protein
MATVNVQGSVSRVFWNGQGAEITEEFQVRGEERRKRWAAFFDAPHGLLEGQQVEVSGLHSDQIDEWPDRDDPNVTRRAVKRSLSKARIVGEVAPAGLNPADDGWNLPTGVGSVNDDDAPF